MDVLYGTKQEHEVVSLADRIIAIIADRGDCIKRLWRRRDQPD